MAIGALTGATPPHVLPGCAEKFAAFQCAVTGHPKPTYTCSCSGTPMKLLPQTQEILNFLQRNPALRQRIRAPTDATLLYAGHFFGPIYRELRRLKQSSKAYDSKVILPEVLKQIATPGAPYPDLLAWAMSFDDLLPPQKDSFVVWRALSGIYAANAVGVVSMAVGSIKDNEHWKAHKVFAATELSVLLNNKNIDATTKELLFYYQRCIKSGVRNINVGLIAGAD